MFESSHFDNLKALSKIRRHTPEVGDYWSEMFCPVLVVVRVTDSHVMFCKTIKEVDSAHWTWNLSKFHMMSREGFAKYLTYETKDTCWCEVSLNPHHWVAEEIRKLSEGV